VRARIVSLAVVLNLGVALWAAAIPTAPTGSARSSLPAPQVLSPEPGEHEAPPDEWLLAQRLSGGPIPARAYELAARQAARLPLLGSKHPTASFSKSSKQSSWQFVGPTNIGGRVMDIAVDTRQANTIYVATATGGLWKSTNGGQTLQSIWPNSLSQSFGAVAITPQGTLFAGTGETGPGGGSMTFAGSGLYRSTNGGKGWTRVLGGTHRIARIAIDPKDSRRIFVAVSGDLFNPGGNRGVFRSTNGGATWKLVLKGATRTTGAADLSIDPSNPNRVYATMWDHRRQPDLRTYGGIGSGVYRSTDGGNTWQRLGGGLPAPAENIGRIGLGVAPSNPDHLYVIVIREDGRLMGFFTSLDGGDSWVELPDDPALMISQSTYGWWFSRVWVDPLLETHVFVGGVFLMQSLTGGLGWIPDATTHADDHAMAWDPKVLGRVYLGNDGGVYRSDLFGLGADWTKATYEPYTQFYSVDVSQQDLTRLVGGTQDNGVNRSYSGGGSGGPKRWNGYVGGDGLAARIDFTSQNRVYGCLQYGVCYRSTDGGDSTSSFGSTKSSRRNWFTPVEFDPSDPKVMYYGGNILNRSTDYAASWKAISPDLTGGPGRDKQYPFGTMTSVAVAKSNGKVIYVGTDDGRLWFTRNLGKTWTRAKDADLPKTWVTRVAVDPKNANVAYATFSGFRAGRNQPYVLRTTDGGKSWSDISRNLPQAPVNCVVLIGGRLYVATDVGVFSASPGGSWSTVAKGLPLVPVTDLRYQSKTKTLVAATFGRGMWSTRV
jgi:photosystem II stability/assembly factor-like uncharacterized protein